MGFSDKGMSAEQMEREGIFFHECEQEGCKIIVEFDDEPFCFTHSPDEGSSLFGYSAREEAGRKDKVD
jgi:hypothetical protein